MLDMLKVIILGIVEGITEWLPISSTGHLILVDEFIKLGASRAFKEMFNVVIQLGAIFTKEIKKTESVYDSVVDEGDCCMFTGGCSWNPVG